jgi:HlyD family secretion protein
MVRTLFLPALAIAALGYTSWHVARTSKTAPQAEPVVTPARSPYADVVAGAGIVEPRSENIEVAAVVPGTIIEVAARVGGKVTAGDVLFRLDDRSQRAALAVQEARLGEALATLERWVQLPRPEDLPASTARVQRFESDLTLRQDQLRRARELVKQRVVTDQELVEREQALSATEAELRQAQAEDERLQAGAWEADLAVARTQVELSRQLVEQARVELDRLVVRAPINGTVLMVDVRPGEYVGTPAGKPLVILGDLETLHARVDIDEQDLPRFTPGQPGRGFVRGDAATPLELEFVRVEPLAEPKKSLTGAGNERIDTRVLQVIYAIKSPPRSVYVGQQIDVFLDACTEAPALLTRVRQSR